MSGDRAAQKRRRRARQRAAAAERPTFNDRPVCTIFADASFRHTDKSAGYGCWIKADGKPALTKAGRMTAGVPTSQEAEIRALANALAIALGRGLVADGACVMLQSDCLAALAQILRAAPVACSRPAPGGIEVPTPPRWTPSMRRSAGLKAIQEMAKARSLKIVVRHVRGHTNHADGRHGVNRLVDGLAGAARAQGAT